MMGGTWVAEQAGPVSVAAAEVRLNKNVEPAAPRLSIPAMVPAVWSTVLGGFHVRPGKSFMTGVTRRDEDQRHHPAPGCDGSASSGASTGKRDDRARASHV
jgi:hypothetical protein